MQTVPGGQQRGALRRVLAAALMLLPSAPAHAGSWSGSAMIGAAYDSNVSVDETDITAREGDAAVIVGASVDYKPVDGQTFDMKVGYSYDGTFHQTITSYDLELHQASAGAALRRGKATFAVDYRFVHARLDRSAFLNMHYAAPSVSGFVTRSGFARLGFAYTRKAYRTSALLDAETRQVSADFYRFFARRKGYVAVGLRHDAENASGPQYDYRANQASIRVQVPFRLLGTTMRARLTYAYAERDYRHITPSIGVKRREQRSTVGAALDLPITGRLTFRPSARYVDRASNLPAFDYREHSLAAALHYRL